LSIKALNMFVTIIKYCLTKHIFAKICYFTIFPSIFQVITLTPRNQIYATFSCKYVSTLEKVWNGGT